MHTISYMFDLPLCFLVNAVQLKEEPNVDRTSVLLNLSGLPNNLYMQHINCCKYRAMQRADFVWFIRSDCESCMLRYS
jgi:hypothetical protein